MPSQDAENQASAAMHLVHSRERKLLCALPVATLWVFGLAVFAYLNTNF